MKAKANAVKTEILSNYDVFTSIPKVADVKAEIKGTEYRVKIKKGEITKILADRKAVWTPQDDVDAMKFIDDLVHPVAEQKIDAAVEEKPAKKEAPKKEKVVVDDKWINFLQEKANESDLLREGDEIRFRVARSHGKPVCAHVDLYTEGEKVATAGIRHRVGFATRGVDDRWTNRVNAAIKEIYRKIGDGRLIKKGGALVRIEDDLIRNAEGPISAVLDIIENL
jgi:hypothetical protein